MKGTHADVLNHASSYSIMKYIEAAEKRSYYELVDEEDPDGGRFPPYEAYERAKKKIGFTGGDISDAQRMRKTADDWISKHRLLFGADAHVRIRTGILFRSRDGVGLPPMDFGILAAIYSTIGDKPMAHVSLSWIRYRAAGCKSKEVFEKWADRGEVYTDKQIRRAVDRLHAGGEGYFSRATFNRAETYYSHRLSHDQLRAEIIETKVDRKRKQAALREEDARMFAQIAASTLGQPEGDLGATLGQPSGDVPGNLGGKVAGDTNRNLEIENPEIEISHTVAALARRRATDTEATV